MQGDWQCILRRLPAGLCGNCSARSVWKVRVSWPQRPQHGDCSGPLLLPDLALFERRHDDIGEPDYSPGSSLWRWHRGQLTAVIVTPSPWASVIIKRENC